MRKIYSLGIAALLMMLFGGCQLPEYYQEQAVIEAREFLLDKSPDLTLDEVAFIKYNRPVIVHENILGTMPSIKSDTVGSDLSQIGIVWKIPERKEMIMVWGVASESLRFFTPERVIIREFKAANMLQTKALQDAKLLLLNNLHKEFSVEEYNYVRFAEPEIVLTSFVFDKEKTADEELTKDKVQFSFVWQIRNGDFKAVVAGEAYQDFSSFIPYACGIFDEKEFNEHFVKTYQDFVAENIAKAAEDAKLAEEKAQNSDDMQATAETSETSKTAEIKETKEEPKEKAKLDNDVPSAPDERETIQEKVNDTQADTQTEVTTEDAPLLESDADEEEIPKSPDER
ncbi:MAG: hypothetical protein IJW31_10080 [Lentisphaeria bacterium]|nr:hypothetical protein [Lentisphaeria bacterium]